MKLPSLIDLSLILILASNSNGQAWNVTVPRHINTTLGSDVTIPCTFSYPEEFHTDKVQVYWKKLVKSKFNTNDKDQNAFIFHPNDTFVLEKYRGKTSLTGNKVNGDCSLKILNIMDNEQNLYVRVIAKQNYSFWNVSVSISVSGVRPVTINTDSILYLLLTTTETTKMGMHQNTSTQMYTTIFVPVAALLIIISVAGIVFYIKHKRSQSFTREESGYYANFSRTSSDQVKREAFSKQDNNKLPELKVIDEPVYVNTEALPGQMDQSMDHTDSIYANVDYSK